MSFSPFEDEEPKVDNQAVINNSTPGVFQPVNAESQNNTNIEPLQSFDQKPAIMQDFVVPQVSTPVDKTNNIEEKEVTVQPQKPNAGSGLPINPTNNPFIDAFEDEELSTYVATQESKDRYNNSQYHVSGDEILRALEKSSQSLMDKYPAGGIKRARFLTAEILLSAPYGYFDKYEDHIRKTLVSVQNQVTNNGQSSIIGNAQNDPTNDALQDNAYRTINSILLTELDKLPYKGIERQLVSIMVINELLGMGRLDPLWRDRRIDEIICNGPFDVQVEIAGQLYKVPSCKFRDVDHMMGLIEKLYASIGKNVSRTTPLVKGRLHDKSRMFAVHNSVAPEGPNFSIRRHPAGYWTPEGIISKGSASIPMMTEIGNLIYKGCSFLVLGGTSTGKTSMLNALTGFYRDSVRILTLEDNLEMKPNPNKFLAAAMECIPSRADREGEGVTMRDLVKASLQLRPDGIIIGEVTDGAAYDLCQALNTGHFGASTLHANDEADGIYRIASLVAQSGLAHGESIYPLIAAAFDFVIYLEHYPVDGSRRISSISEIDTVATRGKDGQLTLKTKPLWKFNNKGLTQDGRIFGDWVKVGSMSETRRQRRHLDIEKDLNWEELVELSKIEYGE